MEERGGDMRISNGSEEWYRVEVMVKGKEISEVARVGERGRRTEARRSSTSGPGLWS